MSEEQRLLIEELIEKCNEGYASEVIEAFLKYHGSDLLDEDFKKYLIDEGLVCNEENCDE